MHRLSSSRPALPLSIVAPFLFAALAACSRPASPPPQADAASSAPLSAAAPASAPSAKDRKLAIQGGSSPLKLPKTIKFDPARLKKEARSKGRLLLERPRTAEELPTTSCAVYLGNLQSQLDGRKKAAEAQPDQASHQRFYAELLYANGEVYGNLDLMSQAEEVATRAIKLEPREAAGYELRAKIRATLHRFDGAVKDYQEAIKLAPSQKDDLELALANVRFQLGDYDAIPLLQKAVVDRPSFGTQSQAGILYWQLGDVTRAKRHFALAEQLYSDTSPTPLAWLSVQRGLLAMHSGDYAQARTFFHQAWERCDKYPLAKEHLAEIEGRLGERQRSMKLYAEVVQQTSNPEFIAALAELQAAEGDEQRAKESIIFARAKNEQLLKKHPEAMYWHAAEFYLGIGADPKKGLELLEKNVKLRPGASSWAALAAAQLDNGQLDKAVVSIEKALASPVQLAEFHWTAARIYQALEARTPPKAGAPSRFATHREKALAMNPKIEDLEGPLTPPAP